MHQPSTRSALAAFTLAAAALAAPAHAAPATAQTGSFAPATERALQGCAATAAQNPRLPAAYRPVVEELVRAIGAVYQGEGEDFSARSASGLCYHFGFTLDNLAQRVADGYCYAPVLGSGDPDKNGIRFRFCPDENGAPVFDGAWRVTAREAAREDLAQDLRQLLEAVSTLEHGAAVDSRETWHSLLDMLARENFEGRLADGDCTTERLHVTGHNYDVKLCKEGDVLAPAPRHAVRPAP